MTGMSNVPRNGTNRWMKNTLLQLNKSAKGKQVNVITIKVAFLKVYKLLCVTHFTFQRTRIQHREKWNLTFSTTYFCVLIYLAYNTQWPWPNGRLTCWTPDRVVRVRALGWVIVLCSWERYFTLTVPLSTQEYKWLPATKCWGITCDGLASHPGGVATLLVGFMLRKPG